MSYNIQNPESFRANIRNKMSDKLGELNILKRIAEKHCIKPDTVAVNMEKGVFNYAIRECNFRKLVKKWENPAFVQIYIDRLRMIHANIESAKNTQPKKTRNYRLNNIAVRAE